MTKQLTYIVVREILGVVPWYAIDESLPQVRARFKRLTGRFPSSRAVITAFTGTFEDLEKIQVNDMGEILYSSNLVKAKIQ